MPLEIKCVWCNGPLLDVEHAKKHVAEKCPAAPWRKQIADLREVVEACRVWFAEDVEQSGQGDAWKMRDRCAAALGIDPKEPKKETTCPSM